MERRNFIRAGLAMAGAAGVAGCLGDDGPGGLGGGSDYPSYDLPAYSGWPPAAVPSQDFVLFTHFNLDLEDSGTFEPPTPDQSTATPGEADESSLLAFPLVGAFVTLLAVAFGTWGYPWSGRLGSDDEPDGMDTHAITVTDGVLVFHGTYDPEVFADRYAEDFEERERDAFTVFEGRSGGMAEDLAYAVSAEAVVVAYGGGDVEDPARRLEVALGNHIDEVDRVVDDEDGEWLFETTGPADAATGLWNIDGIEAEDLEFGQGDAVDEEAEEIEDSPVFEDVRSLVGMLALPASEGGVGGDGVALRFAALYPEGEVPSEEELRDEFAIGDAELYVTTSDDRAHVAVEVSEDELQTAN